MRPRRQHVPTRFGPETRFNLAPMVTAAPSPDTDAELELLKRKLVRRFVAETTSPAARRRIRQAVDEAAARAWAAGNPLLLLPVLAEEMSATAQLWADKQERIREQSESLLPELVQR